MGIRSKIFLLFMAIFLTMSTLASWLLFGNLQDYFKRLELQNALTSLDQLKRTLDSELTHLNEINTDWSVWDRMYDFAQNPTADFTSRDLNADALLSAHFSLAVIFNAQPIPIYELSMDTSTEQETDINHYQSLINLFTRSLARDPWSNGCGLYQGIDELLMVCWQAIRKNNRTGDYVGTFLVGRALSNSIRNRIQRQSGIDFSMSNIPLAPSHQEILDRQKSPIAITAIQVKPEGAISAQFTNLLHSPALKVEIPYSHSISEQGQALTLKVMILLGAVVIVSTLALMIGIHHMLIERLRRISSEVKAITHNNQWDKPLSDCKGQDELTELRTDINHLLYVINEQVDKLQTMTMTDALTGVANRRAFDQRLSIEMKAQERNGRPLALIMLDVDYFKRYNDHYGHPAGDKALQTIGKILRNVARRPSDLAVRIGGEEFAIILPDTPKAGAIAIAEKLQEELAKANIVHEKSLVSPLLTLSMGITLAINETTSSFVARADMGVYQSKNNGRNCITLLLADL